MRPRSSWLLVGVAAFGLLAGLGQAWAHLPVLAADPVWSKASGGTVYLSHAYGHPHPAEWLACPRPDAVVVHDPSGEASDVTATLEAFDDPKQRKWRARFTPKRAGDHVAELRCRTRVGKTRFDDVIKLVVHAGGPPRGWDRRIGAPLEFVPLTRPYLLPKGASVRFRLEQDGQPVAGAIVGLEHMNDEPPQVKVPSEVHMVRQEKTNAQGELTVALPEEGWWVLFASVGGGQVEEDGQVLSRLQRASFWVRVGW
jgi:cobalt/nickel transport protein